MEGLQKITSFTYQTQGGKTITATKNNGTVTLYGNDGAVKQVPVDKFWQEFMATVKRVDKAPNQDTITLGAKKSNNPFTKVYDDMKKTPWGNVVTLQPMSADDSLLKRINKILHNSGAVLLNPTNAPEYFKHTDRYIG